MFQHLNPQFLQLCTLYGIYGSHSSHSSQFQLELFLQRHTIHSLHNELPSPSDRHSVFSFLQTLQIITRNISFYIQTSFFMMRMTTSTFTDDDYETAKRDILRFYLLIT